MREKSSTYGRSCFAPSAQLSPTTVGCAWRIEFQNASTVCPESVRPEASVIVPEIMIGRSTDSSRMVRRTANSAALALSVSNMVSSRIRSAPPSISAAAASL